MLSALLKMSKAHIQAKYLFSQTLLSMYAAFVQLLTMFLMFVYLSKKRFDAGKDTEKLDPFYIADGNIK